MAIKDDVYNFAVRGRNIQSAKPRVKKFKEIFPEGHEIYSLSVEQLEEVELEMLRGSDITYTSMLTDKELDIKTLDDGRGSTRRQNGASFVTLKENCEILTAEKTFTKENSYPVIPPIASDRVDELRVAMGVAQVGDKKCYLRRHDHIKVEVKDGVARQLASEFSLYAMPNGEQGNDTLLVRMDKGRPHDNRAFFGNQARSVINFQAEGYHMHFSNAFVNSLCCKSVIRNSVSTESDAISTVELSAYLKAMDGKSVPALAGVDLAQNFGLPFKYMQEKGLFPNMDLTSVAQSMKSSSNAAVASACTTYLQQTAAPNSFESLTNGLDLLNSMLAEYAALTKSGQEAEAESLIPTLNEIAGQTFDSITLCQDRERLYTATETQVAEQENEESKDAASEGQAGDPVDDDNATDGDNDAAGDAEEEKTKEESANEAANAVFVAKGVSQEQTTNEPEIDKEKTNEAGTSAEPTANTNAGDPSNNGVEEEEEAQGGMSDEEQEQEDSVVPPPPPPGLQAEEDNVPTTPPTPPTPPPPPTQLESEEQAANAAANSLVDSLEQALHSDMVAAMGASQSANMGMEGSAPSSSADFSQEGDDGQSF